jgi:hypothetical protein
MPRTDNRCTPLQRGTPLADLGGIGRRRAHRRREITMTRASVWLVALTAAVAVGCSGSEGASPTSPGGSTSTGSSPQSPQSSCTIPPAPTGLRVTSIAGTTVSLAWSASSGATEYLVLVGSTSGNSEELSTNTTQTAYSYGGAKVGVHYARVQAKNSCGTSGSSNQVDFVVAG